MNIHRRGMSLVELIVTLILLGAALGLMAPVLKSAAAQRRAADERQTALAEAASLLEALTARGWEGTSDELADSVELSPTTAAALRDAVLTVDVADEADPPEVRRITVEIRWAERSGTARPVRLRTWIFRQVEEQP